MGGFFSIFLKPHKIGVPQQVVVPTTQEEPEISYDVEEITETPIVTTKKMFTETSNKLGLLIGINYVSNESKNDDLYGCVNDMNNLCEFLQKDCHFFKEQLTFLENKDASYENIKKEIEYLVYHSNRFPDSEIWFSYSGQGTSQYSFFEKDNRSEVICPSDYQSAGLISDVWLQENFIRKLHKSTKLFVLMDCCNSGSNMNLPYTLENGIETKREYDYDDELCDIVKMSGCRDDQTSADYYDNLDREYQGALTNEFLKLDYRSSMATNIQTVVRNLTTRGFSQRPVLSFSNEKCSEMTLI